MSQLTIYIPDTEPFEVEDNGQTNEEIRSGLIAVGFAQLATAAVSRTGGDVNFERPQGGDKGLL